ncbi:MAG: hypothetical protein SGBAC_010971, partial [Bacillariaceae sp.]
MEVATIVREAGVEIGMDPEEPLLADIIAKLKNEYIFHDWQLGKLDSAQWQVLGAPMGLSVAIQAMIEEEQEMKMAPQKKKQNEPTRYPSGLTSRASQAIQESDQLTSSTRSNGSMAAIRKNPRKTMAKPSTIFNRHGTLQVLEGKNPVEGALDDATEEGNRDSGIFHPTASQQEQPQKGTADSLNSKKCCGKEVASCFRTMAKTELTVENTSCFVMSK